MKKFRDQPYLASKWNFNAYQELLSIDGLYPRWTWMGGPEMDLHKYNQEDQDWNLRAWNHRLYLE